MFPKTRVLKNLGSDMRMYTKSDKHDKGWVVVPYGYICEFRGERNFLRGKLINEYRVRILIEINRGPTLPMYEEWLEFPAMYKDIDFRSFI